MNREQEIIERLSRASQSAHEKALLEKTSARMRLLKLTVKNMSERLADRSQEIVSLKQQADETNAKSQALAVKTIERPDNDSLHK